MNIFASASFSPGNLAAVQEFVTARVLEATTQGTEAVMNDAKEIVHVRSGELQQSIHMVVTLQGQEVIGEVIADSEHAVFNEFGTGIRGAASPGAGPFPYNPTWPGMAAIPFLRPALDQNEKTILDAYRSQGFSV